MIGLLALQQGAQRLDSVQVSLRGHPQTALDSVSLANPPLPGGIAAFVRYLFHVPQWIQIGGAIAAIVLVLGLVALIWQRRLDIWRWLATRSLTAKLVLLALVNLFAIGAVAFGTVSWQYMQHDNNFCSGCHVMAPAFERFRMSEHKKLECHSCHRQSIFASARQLYFWVLDRPERIPPHAKVPTHVCAECHIQRDPDSTWKRIVATAGHRLHLNSDSSALKNVQCVTCHGQTVHRFRPVDQTCGQSNCHENVTIKLGKMANQTPLHCVGCHEFTKPIDETAVVSTDSAARAMIPGQKECFGCHEMRQKLAAFAPARDPHKAACGACHNPHTQTTPRAAVKTCENSGCHARPDTLTPFHRGIGAKALGDCLQCHKAHDWKVGKQVCTSCHSDVMRRPPHRLTFPLRMTRVSAADTPPKMPFILAGLYKRQSPADTATFSHAQHRTVDCKSCHSSERSHGALTISTLRDCQSCHHAAERTSTGCVACHRGGGPAQTYKISQTVSMTVRVSNPARELSFSHRTHTKVACAQCHTTPVTLAANRTCASCHADHHTAQRNCQSCHASPQRAHTRVVHQGCAGSDCHRDAATLALAATRNVCLVCHQNQVNHKPGRECAVCHNVNWRPSGRASGPGH